jgi:hypothetical protein
MLRLSAITTAFIASTLLTPAVAQITDSVPAYQEYTSVFNINAKQAEQRSHRMQIKSFLLPAGLIAYGAFTFKYDQLQKVDYRVKEEVYDESQHKKLPIDDYMQYAPAVAVYGLNLAGIKGRHNFVDRTIIYAMSDIILNVVVSSGKSLTKKMRPDGSNNLSFPSGHTAHAFASAEFMRQEYKDVSPWYGYAGYAVAIATGYLRIHNNRHWFSDVAAGAGIGIASTKISYWLYPKIQRVIFPKSRDKNLILPSYSDGSLSLNFVHRF